MTKSSHRFVGTNSNSQVRVRSRCDVELDGASGARATTSRRILGVFGRTTESHLTVVVLSNGEIAGTEATRVALDWKFLQLDKGEFLKQHAARLLTTPVGLCIPYGVHGGKNCLVLGVF